MNSGHSSRPGRIRTYAPKMVGTPIVERDSEIASLGRLMARITGGRGGLCAIEGPAGIGKTRLLTHARQRATNAGWRVIDTRCTPMTPTISHVLLRDWFSGIAQRNGSAIDGPARVLQELSDDVQSGVGDLVYGARWVLEEIAQEQPVMLIVDDLHWADTGSLEVLDLLVSTIQHLPCLVLYAVRSGEPVASSEALARVRMSSTVLSPAPLSQDAVLALLRHHDALASARRRPAHPRDVRRRAVLRPGAAQRRRCGAGDRDRVGRRSAQPPLGDRGRHRSGGLRARWRGDRRHRRRAQPAEAGHRRAGHLRAGRRPPAQPRQRPPRGDAPADRTRRTRPHERLGVRRPARSCGGDPGPSRRPEGSGGQPPAAHDARRGRRRPRAADRAGPRGPQGRRPRAGGPLLQPRDRGGLGRRTADPAVLRRGPGPCPVRRPRHRPGGVGDGRGPDRRRQRPGRAQGRGR